MDLYSRAVRQYPSIGNIFTPDVLIIGGIVLLGLIVLGIFWLRNRRAKDLAIERSGGFGGIEGLKRKGLISEEEAKVIRQKLAQAHLREVQEEQTKGMDAGTMLAALETDPRMAGELLAPPDPLVQRAMAEYYAAREKKAKERGGAGAGGGSAGGFRTAGGAAQDAGGGVRGAGAAAQPLKGEPPRAGAPVKGEPPRVGPPVAPGARPPKYTGGTQAPMGEAPAEPREQFPDAADNAGDPLAGPARKPTRGPAAGRPHPSAPDYGRSRGAAGAPQRPDVPGRPAGGPGETPAGARGGPMSEEDLQARLPPGVQIPPARKEKKSSGRALDLDKLLQQGLITPEEYQRLLAKLDQVKD